MSDAPDKYPKTARFPDGVSFHHRDEIDRVQRALRGVKGVSALIYDQTCAAEARRLRKRGEFPDPDQRVVINELVCEGCGDCSVQSNCISIEPVETDFGRKRRVNQSSCNKDYSCLKGYCPSFVTVHGARLRRAERGVADEAGDALFGALPAPPVADTERPWNVLVTGIGGSGVVTVGALIGMAAHLEGRGVSVLDVTGLAQKNGPVTSHVRVADDPAALHASRIAAGAADLLLGCDIVVASGADSLLRLAKGRTHAVVNAHVAPTSDFATNPDLDLSSRAMEAALSTAVGDEAVEFPAANALATALLGDAIGTNLFLVGYALQRGWIPVGLPALERAIELNGRAVELNKRALSWGRLAAHDPAAVERAARPTLRAQAGGDADDSLEALVERRVAFLTDYQSARYARRYRARVERVASRERELGLADTPLAETVARAYSRLLAYKDEYEVARLFSDGSFQRQLTREFEGDYTVRWQLAPPHIPLIDRFVNRRDPDTGRAGKWSAGPWAFRALRWLARGKVLRGTPLDPFGRAAHRRLERRLIRDYEQLLDELLDGLDAARHGLAVEIAGLPEQVRGFDLVKERQLELANERQAELLARFRAAASESGVAAD